MKRLVVFVVVSCGWIPAGFAGEVNGHVLITKGLTRQRIVLPGYQNRGVSLPLDERRPSASSDEFSRVAIYLEGPGLDPGEPASASLRQQNRRFEPDFVIVPVGSTVSFPNGDAIFHNVFSLSKVKEFDLGHYPAGQSRMVMFNTPGVVQVYCHLHPNMTAVILVTPSRWYTQPGSDGAYSFSELPAGDYSVVAWHKAVGFLKKQARVPATGAVELDFSLPGLGKRENR